MKKLVLAVLLLATSAEAATKVTRYVRTDCSNNGDGTASSCAAGAGAAGAYTTLQNAISDITTDYASFVASDVQVDIDCAGTAADTSSPNVTGITVDATRYLSIFTTQANRHDGKWNTSKYRVENGGYHTAVRLNIPNVRVSGLQIKSTGGSDGGARGIYIDSGAGSATGDIRITNNIIRYAPSGSATTAAAYNTGIGTVTGAINKLTIANNVIYDFRSGGMMLYSGSSDGSAFYVYNNTVADSDTGRCIFASLYGTNDTFKLRNNIMQNCSGNDYGVDSSATTYTTEKNITEDASSPNTTGCNAGGTCRSRVITFADEAADDFHLAAGDTQAKDLGSDLSADGDFAFSDDIDGQTRSGSWDIGADEYQSAAAVYFAPSKLNAGINSQLNGGLN